MKITEFMKDNLLCLDGGTGTLLQKAGLVAGEKPERWNLSNPSAIVRIHRDYFDAGSNIVCTNTFGANSLKFSEEELGEIIASAVKNARQAQAESSGRQPKWVALDIGPTGRMLKPYGDLDFEEAVEVFAKTVRLGAEQGVDLIFIETMTDSYETKAALLAVKENSDLPVFVSNAYGDDGKLLTGATPAAMVALLEGMGADAIGVNCSLGPKALSGVAMEYIKYSSLPVILKPNAGLPSFNNGVTEYDTTPSEFAKEVKAQVECGVRIVGGCCGTTPEYIAELAGLVKDFKPSEAENKNITLVSSYARAEELGNKPLLIGERINPTGKPRLREALHASNMDYLLKEAIGQEERGAHILDVNVGAAGVDESVLLAKAVCHIQAVCPLPLQIDTANPSAMEKALRYYNGKAMINSVNGKAESMDSVFPLAKKYGGVLVALTLDEDGIPPTAEGRVDIAKRILAEAKRYGIDKKNIIFDPLAMAVSADKNAALETLRAVKMIKELGAHTSLGVSNVSFGLPNRESLNSVFFVRAMENGLSAAIMNPYSEEMMKAYRSHLALSGMDSNFEEYIGALAEEKPHSCGNVDDLKTAVIKGMKDRASTLTKELLLEKDHLKIINEEIIPALNLVGEGFEKKTVYLPSLLMSAEAAGASFDVIKSSVKKSDVAEGLTVILATVKGDIHDIGKNIVKLILENYGFNVKDLGKDVSPEKIAEEAVNLKADLVGLSALMTTTLPAMEETIALIRSTSPRTKIMVGGAVLTEKYAKNIGADFYGKDAMEAVKIAKSLKA